MSKHFAVLASTMVVAMLVLTACGGGGSSSSSSTSAADTSSQPASSSEPSGEPVKLMSAGPIESPAFSLPSIPVGAEIAVEEVNKEGGLAGHPVELVVCNDENNPNTATQCARQAVKEEVAALVGGFSDFDLKMIPYLEQAGIPWVGPTTPDDAHSKNLFLIGGEGMPTFTGIGLLLANEGCKNIAIVKGSVSPEANSEEIEAGVLAGGAKVATKLEAPASGADWAPIAAAARSAGADCLGSTTGPEESGPLISAVDAGQKLKMAFPEGGLPEVVLQQIGAPANGVFSPSGFLPSGSKEGIVPELRKKYEAKNVEAPFDTFAKGGYASVKVVQQAAEGLEEVDASTLMEALPGVKNYDTELGPVVDLSTPNSIPGFERLFNPESYILVAKNGEYQLAQPEPIDTTPALEILSEKGS